jgi:hypothetical protein
VPLQPTHLDTARKAAKRAAVLVAPGKPVRRKRRRRRRSEGL